MSFSAVSGWIDFIRRVVFFNSYHVSLGRSSVFFFFAKRVKQPNSWATTHSAISFFTDYQWNWRQIVLIYVNGNWLWRISRLVRFLAILNAAEFLRRHEVWILFTSMILTENRKCDCPSINSHKIVQKVQELRPELSWPSWDPAIFSRLMP